LFYWDELSSPPGFSLTGGIGATDTTITLSAAGAALPGDLIQIEAEILQVTGSLSGGTHYTVTRGSHGSAAAAHSTGAAIYHLQRNITIVPFVKGFFGSQASGSFSYSIFQPDVRVGAAEFFVTNTIGGSPVAAGAFGATIDQGLRTLAGGQLSIQVEGYLAMQTDAAPPLIIDTTQAVRDIFATVGAAPSGGPVQLQLRQGTTVYCTLAIADGTTTSNVINGFGLPPLTANSELRLDVLAVPTAANSLSGQDLTVTIRL
jgi:hypothetical protein